MMKIWFSKYELEPISNLNSRTKTMEVRHGSLLKVQWPNGKQGYADLFPWPELGDLDLGTQLVAIKQGKLTTLAEQAIWLAKEDAKFRAEKKSFFAGSARIKNHFLISDISSISESAISGLRSAGFTTIKLKVGRRIEEETKFISRLVKQNPFVVRLDFNASVDFTTYKKFMTLLDLSERAKIEFVEDPIPWDYANWKEAATFAPLAMDQEIGKVDWESLNGRPPFKVLILKPARQDAEQAINLAVTNDLKICVTSALDHPVGVAHACHIASEIKAKHPSALLDCGFLSLRSYKPNEFSARVLVAGPYLNGINGTGVGFDDLLEQREWTPIEQASIIQS